MAPYVLAAAVIGGLVWAVRQPRLAQPAGLLLGLLVMGALGYVAMSYRINLAPEDRLRRLLPLVTLLALIAAGVPFGFTVYPPPPQAEVSLAAPGDARELRVRGAASTVGLTVQGRFAPGATGGTNYFLTVQHDGASERIDGTFRRQAGGPPPERHVLAARGPGRYTVRLESVSGAVALPLRVAITARPFSTLLLLLIYGALGAVVLAVDVMLWRRGIEPSFASALMVPMAAVVYFQRHPASDTLANDLLAAGILGLLAGGLGGELLARAARAVVGK